MILFKPLTKDNISGIVELIVDDLNKRLADREISISLTPAAKQYVADNAYDANYGARPIKRFITKNIETLLAENLLNSTIKEGDSLLIDVKEDKFVIKVLN
jgi:ATP-dependent Clp protease ATP-binding subunit ClpB